MRGSIVVLIRVALLAAVLGAWQVLPRSASSTRCCCRRSPRCCTRWATSSAAPACTSRSPSPARRSSSPSSSPCRSAARSAFSLAESDYIGAIFKPVLFYVFSIPKSVFLPMFILTFGIGFPQKVAYATFSTIFIVIMSASAAVESVKADHLLVARSYGATRGQILRRVYVPEHDADPARDPAHLDDLQLHRRADRRDVCLARSASAA